MNELPATLEELARFRQGMYRIFAASFLPPHPERLVEIIAASDALERMGLPYLAFYHEWVPWASTLHSISDTISLDIEYVRMFATGIDGAVSPPTESFYVADPIRGEVAEVLAQLRMLYDKYRLTPTTVVSDTLDHVSIQLEVLSALCATEADARASDNETRLKRTLGNQLEFIETHLGVWLPQFVDRIASAETVPFYAQLGPAVASFVHHDMGVICYLHKGATHPELAQ
ncbi:MAG: molecular chaperone [Acidimicrobiales bacterium]